MERGKFFNILLSVILVAFSYELKAQQLSVYEVEKMPFNLTGFNNISPVLMKDGILFCSDKRYSGFTDRTSFDGRRLYNVYITQKKDTSDFQKPVVMNSERNNKFNIGPFCVSADGKTIFFTSEVETGRITNSKKFRNHSGLFIADLSGNEISSIKPFKYNDPKYDIGQPSVSRDGKYLFFASDMPGGNGGSDLYYCQMVNGEWSAPVNLGPKVNSQNAENYPFIHPSGKLYFTSNRPGGMGRLDIYMTNLKNGEWEEPVLLPAPVNSKFDDFAFVADANLQTGYFSSNRGTEDDIYKFVSTIIRKEKCDSLQENNYCYRFFEENAVKHDSIPFRYEWKFGDGNSATGPVVEYCYTNPGTYTVQLDVENLITHEITYNEKSETVVVTEIEQPYISAPDRITPNQHITLSADSTNLPGWNITRYYWNFGDETISVGKNVTKSYLRPGTYNIQLIISAEPGEGGNFREACVSKNINVSQ